MTRNLILFLMVVFTGVASYYVVHLGHYPVAIVNGTMITAKALNEEYAVAFQYYARTLSGQKEINPNSRDVQKELRRATLNDLVQKALISAELKTRVGDDLDSVVESKISTETKDSQALAEAAKILYGLDFVHFKQMVLVPQAEKELLQGRLFLENKKFADWLGEAEKSAKVTILTPEFSWATNKVVAK